MRAFNRKQVLCILVQATLLSFNAMAQGITQPSASVLPTLHLKDGKPFQVYLYLPDCKADNPATQPDEHWKITTLSGSGVSVQGSPTIVAPCQLIANFTIDPSALTGPQPIFVDTGKGPLKVIGSLNLVDIVPGAIPPGIIPQVDVMWTVMSPGVTGDTFGRWISKKYYAIQITIGNNTGYELQVASVGFQLRNPNGMLSDPKDDGGSLAQWNHASNNDYHVVRATPEREQIAGPRAIVLSVAEALALFGSGLTPFFKNIHHQDTYSTALSIFGDPVSKGISLVWPDLTVPDLNRLDNLALHDNTVIPNNSQAKTIVFVDRRTLDADFAKKPSDKGSRNLVQAAQGPCEGTQGFRKLCNGNEPQDVKYWLGNLILVGDEIEYKQRIHVGASLQTAIPATVTMSPSDFTDAALANSAGVKVTLTAPNGDLSGLPANTAQTTQDLQLTLDSAGSDKTVRTGLLKAINAKYLSPGLYALVVPLQNGSQNVNFTVKSQQITITPNPITAASLKKSQTVTLTGDDLTNSAVSCDSPLQLTLDPLPTGSAKTRTGKLTATGTVATQTYNIYYGPTKVPIAIKVQ